MNLPPLLAVWGLPDGVITALAVAVAGGVGWLVKHVTTRSGERAILLRTSADRRETENATVVSRAIESYERQLTACLSESTALREENRAIQKDHGERLARIERRAGRMNHFIVKLLDAYLQIKAYVLVLENIVVAAQPAWRKREFPDIELPNFEDEAPLTPPARQP